MNEATRNDRIEVRGARVHNLQSVNIDIPLGKLVAIAGVSGSGKSSLALGVLYAEGSRRYLEALSTYTRRRIGQAENADVDSVEHIPAALALHQRPDVPSVRSTFGTSTELLSILRLMFSRLGSHCCPNGHHVPPSLAVARGMPLVCPVCGVLFNGPSAESFSFNSDGGCPRCAGTGIIRDIDDNTLVPDDSLTLEQGCVGPWNMFGINWMFRVAEDLGVRIDVPFRDLTAQEKQIVLHGPDVIRKVPLQTSNGKVFDLNCNYRNAHRAVEEALKKTVAEKGLDRINRYLAIRPCPECNGTRLSAQARSTLLDGKDLATASTMTLTDLTDWISNIPITLPTEMRPMAKSIADEFLTTSQMLLDLGLGYLTLDRAGATLSTGERQRVQLARSVRNRTTGVLYVLDEPTVGLHPANVDGLLTIVRRLVADGNSVVIVDHDVRVLRAADWLIEMGPGAGDKGGRVVTAGTVATVAADPASLIGPFIAGKEPVVVRNRALAKELFSAGTIKIATEPVHTVKALQLALPQNRLIAVTGVSGSGKTTLILESLVPALQAHLTGMKLPTHVRNLDAAGIKRVELVDATPIGTNVRSTVATYCGVLDTLRCVYAATPDAKRLGYKAGDFSYNTGALRCPACDGTGTVSLDVQFLPDLEIVCPDCSGNRYAKTAWAIRPTDKGVIGPTLPELMSLTVDQALVRMKDVKAVQEKLAILCNLGLGYLTLGEATPALSGGEAQRLKLATEMGRSQAGSLFVFDEPTIGLHPLDVRMLTGVFQQLITAGATVIVIEHDLDLIANADYVVDLGPGGGEAGGMIVANGTPEAVASDPASLTGHYLAEALRIDKAAREKS